MPTKTTYHGLWKCKKCGTDELINTQLFCPNCGAPIPMCDDGTPDTRQPKASDIPRYTIRDQEKLRRIHAQEGVWECKSCRAVHPDEESYCETCGDSKSNGQPVQPTTSTSYSSPIAEAVARADPAVGKAVLDNLVNSIANYTPSTSSYAPSSYVAPTSTPVHGDNDVAEPDDDEPAYEEPVFDYTSSYRHSASYGRAGISPWWFIIVPVAAIIIAFVGIWFYREHFVRETLPAQVVGVTWYRWQTIEAYVWVDDSNQSGCPVGSRNCKSGEEKIRSDYVKTGSHQEDKKCTKTIDGACSTSKNADGSWTETCEDDTTEEYVCGSETVDDYEWVDVYGTVYRFQVQRWVFSRNAETRGTNWEPYSPSDYTLAGSHERLGGSGAEYTVTFRAPTGSEYTWRNGDENLWRQFQNNDKKFIIIINGNGGVVYAGLPEAAPR